MTVFPRIGMLPLSAPLVQIQGMGTSAHSDLYAVAATLYHLLVGMPAPDALTRAAATINDQPDPLIPLHQANPQVGVAVSAVLTQALRLSVAQRPSSAARMRHALQAATVLAATEVTVVGAITQERPVVRPRPPAAVLARRRQWWIGVLTIIVPLLGGLAIRPLWRELTTPDPRLPREEVISPPTPIVPTTPATGIAPPTVPVLTPPATGP